MQKEELKAIIMKHGLTQSDVAKILGMSDKTFSIKLKTGDFGSRDVDKMIEVLEIEDPMWIFFDRKVTLKDTKKIIYQKADIEGDVINDPLRRG